MSNPTTHDELSGKHFRDWAAIIINDRTMPIIRQALDNELGEGVVTAEQIGLTPERVLAGVITHEKEFQGSTESDLARFIARIVKPEYDRVVEQFKKRGQ